MGSRDVFLAPIGSQVAVQEPPGGFWGDPGTSFGDHWVQDVVQEPPGFILGGSRHVTLGPLGPKVSSRSPSGLIQELKELKKPFQAFLWESVCINHAYLQQDLRFCHSMTVHTVHVFVVTGVLGDPTSIRAGGQDDGS